MAEEAEKVAVEVLAKVDGFDGKIRQSATAFEGGMKRIEQSGARAEAATGRAMIGVERSMGRASQASRNLGFQISDISTQLASGTSPFLILAQQGPQVANALDGAKGKIGQFATFLSGPWGAALLGATTLLGVFGSKLFDTGESVDDLVDKLKEQARKTADSDKATELFGKTTEGVTQALKDNKEALDKLKGAQDSAAEAALARAQQQAAEQLRIQEITQALLEQAKAREQVAQSIGVQPGGDPAAAAIVQSQAASRIAQLEAAIAQGRKNIEEARRQVTDAQSLVSVDRGTESKEDQVTRRYAKRIEDARKLAVAQGKVGDELERQVRALQVARDAEIKRIRDAEAERKKNKGELTSFINPVGSGPVTGRFGEQRPGHTHAGIDIAVPVGTGVKAAAGGTIITAGNLPGYGNVIIVDHGSGTTTRYAHLSSVLAKRGDTVNQGQVIGLSGGARGAPGSGNSQGPHLHYEVRSGGKAVDPRTGRYATDQLGAQAKTIDDLQRQAEAEVRRRQTFENELANLQGDEVEARKALIAAAEEIARLETQAIEISRKKYDDNLDSLVEQKKLTDEEATQLRALNDERAKLRTELVQRREDQRKFRMQEAEAQRKVDAQLAGIDVQQELLDSQEGIATTAKDRRDIGRRLVDLSFQEEKIQNDAIIAASERLKIEMDRLATLRSLSDEEKAELQRAQDRAAAARERNGTLPERQGNAQTGNDRANASPIKAWMDEVPQSADQINEAFEKIAAGGLTALSDGIADAIVNFRNLGDVARSILQMILSELIKVIVKMLIVKALKAIFGLADGGGVGGGPSTGQGAAVPGLSPGGLAGGGPARFPGGGHVFGPGTSTSDSIPAWLSDGEYVIKAKSAAKLGRGILDRMNLTGEMPMGFAGGGAMRAVLPINGMAAPASTYGRGGIDETALRRIETAVERGASAQAPVNLYPTLSPKRAMEEMLKDPGAQRTLFGFLSNNSGRANSALRR